MTILIFSLTVYCELKCLRRPMKAALPLRQMLWATYEKGIGADVIIKAGDKEFKVTFKRPLCMTSLIVRFRA